MQRNYLFDALRGVAAILVVAYHLGDFSYSIAPSGFLAVDVFFVLSGFVIAQAYTGRLSSGLNARRFLVLRTIRLYPLIILGFGLGFCKALGTFAFQISSTYSFQEILTAAPLNVLLLPAPPSIGELFPLNGPAWSLFFEFLANVVFGFWGYRASKKSLVFVAVFAACLTIAVAVYHETMNLGWDWPTFPGGVGRVGFSFTVGHLMQKALSQQVRKETYLALLPIFALMSLLIWSPGFDARTWYWICGGLIISPSIILACATMELPGHLQKLGSFLGDISYPLYAIHFPLLTAFKFILPKVGAPPILTPVIILPALVGCAFLVSRYYDAPLRRLISARWKLRESAKPQVIDTN